MNTYQNDSKYLDKQVWASSGYTDQSHQTYSRQTAPEPVSIAQLAECVIRGTGDHGFDPGPRYTKVIKNGTSRTSLGTQTYRVELGLVDPVSG